MSRGGFSPGDIILMEHRPPDDPSAAKARPAIVLSSSHFNKRHIDVIVAPISSVIRTGDEAQVVVDEDHSDFSKTGLKTTSAVKCGALFACPKSLIRRRLGKASSTILDAIRDFLASCLIRD